MVAPNLSFTQINPKPDPKHGVPCVRSSHGISVIQNGARLVVYGGEHVARTPIENEQALWFCDLDGEAQWKCVTPTGSLPPPRVAHAQAAVGDTVYIFGGRAGITMQEQAMDDVWKLEGETWSEVKTTGDIPCKRSFHRMVSDGTNLYVFGGCGEAGRLADLYSLDLKTNLWTNLGASGLRGRGGPNLLVFPDKLAVVGGFAGEETNDGQIFSLANKKWAASLLEKELSEMRPRSVCIAGTVAGTGVLFGGEVDPSQRGHEGAGGFANDVVLISAETGEHIETVPPGEGWPETRGWSDGTVVNTADKGMLYVFGGLSGDDANPKRLGDLWRLELSAK